MRTPTARWILAFASAAVTPPLAGAAAAEPPPIVARSIAYHGGDVVARSAVSLTLTSRSGSSRIEAWRDGDRFDYTVTAPASAATAGEPERRVRFTNRDGENRVSEWRRGEERVLSGEAAARAESWLAARVYFPFLPFRLADPGVHFTDLGVERWGERELHKVKVTFAAGSSPDADDEYLYWFDPGNGRMEQFAYSFHTGNGGLRLRRAVRWQQVGGVWFSDQENLGVEGNGLAVEMVTEGFAREGLEVVSRVELSEIEVRALE